MAYHPQPTTPEQKKALLRRARTVIRFTIHYWPEVRDVAPYIMSGHITHLAHARAGLAFDQMSQDLRMGSDESEEAFHSIKRVWGLLLLDLDPTEEYWENGVRKKARVGGRPRTSTEMWLEAFGEYRAVRAKLRTQFPGVGRITPQQMRFLPSRDRAAWHKYNTCMNRVGK
jgi:hypothetical protein